MMQPGDMQKVSVLSEVEDWLQDLLASGPIPSTEVFERAKAEGFSKRTLKRAAKRLGITPTKDGMTGGWSWPLPKGAKMPEECQETNVAPFEENDTLRGSPSAE